MNMAALFLSPEQQSIDQALSEGMEAGLKGRSWSVNPYQSNVIEHAKWEEGRKMAESVLLAGMTA